MALRKALKTLRIESSKRHSHIISSQGKSSLENSPSTGLFNIEELKDPSGFLILKDKALTQAQRTVQEIVSQPHGSQKIVPLFDHLSNCLCKVADLAEFVRVAHPDPSFRVASEQASVAISSLVEQLNTDRSLYDVLRNSKFEDALDEHVASLFQFDFEQSGIHLDDDKRRNVLRLNENIIRLGSVFASNASQGRIAKISEIPQEIRHLLTSKERSSMMGQRALVTGLHADSDNDLVRETAYRIYLRPDKQQEDVLTELLQSRLDLAQLCGFESYADRAVKESIAGSPAVVKRFLDILNDRLRGLANDDYQQMLHLKLSANPSASKILNAWDIPFYSANYKRGIYNESVVQCLPYFSVDSCLDGLRMIFKELYGVRMELDDRNDGELWCNDVIKMCIVDDSSNTLLGHIYCDLYDRPMKLHQDCHHTIRGGCQLPDGNYQLPVVVLVLSLPESLAGKPSLLSPSMVDNLFHEMGHAMHSMMARTKYQHVTGTRCSTDLAEVPSILMEFFASDARVVSKFARHHSTGEAIPGELLRSWISSKRVFTASDTQLQVFYAALDQAYHGSAGLRGQSTTELLASIQAQYYPIAYVEETAWQLRFSHLVGYGAKYYAYLVSRAVAGAIWSKLFASDPLSRRAGERFKRQVLEHGGGKPARSIAEDVLECQVDADFIAGQVISSLQEPDQQT